MPSGSPFAVLFARRPNSTPCAYKLIDTFWQRAPPRATQRMSLMTSTGKATPALGYVIVRNEAVGWAVGAGAGAFVGALVGSIEGGWEGSDVGAGEGEGEGALEGDTDGCKTTQQPQLPTMPHASECHTPIDEHVAIDEKQIPPV